MSAMALPAATPTGVTVAQPRNRLVLEGARDMTPMVIGVIPFALAIGAAISASSLSTLEGLASAPAILAGSAQLATVQMLDAGTAAMVVIASAFVINARILLYGAGLAPWFGDLPLRRRLLVATTVIDQTYLTCVPRFERGDLDSSGRVAYYAGASGWLAGAFVATQFVAVGIGTQLPDSLGLELAAPLAMAGLLAKSTTSRPTVVAAVVAGGLAVAAVGLPMHTSLLVATVVGIAAGRVARRLAEVAR